MIKKVACKPIGNDMAKDSEAGPVELLHHLNEHASYGRYLLF